MNEIRNEQLKLYEIGHSEPAGEQLFDRAAIRAALPAVSKIRYEQTLCAEHPALKLFLDKLDTEKTEQSPNSLSKLWRIPSDKAVEIADQLVEAGFFERRGSKDAPTFWVPFLYRNALRMLARISRRYRQSIGGSDLARRIAMSSPRSSRKHEIHLDNRLGIARRGMRVRFHTWTLPVCQAF